MIQMLYHMLFLQHMASYLGPYLERSMLPKTWYQVYGTMLNTICCISIVLNTVPYMLYYVLGTIDGTKYDTKYDARFCIKYGVIFGTDSVPYFVPYLRSMKSSRRPPGRLTPSGNKLRNATQRMQGQGCCCSHSHLVWHDRRARFRVS